VKWKLKAWKKTESGVFAREGCREEKRRLFCGSGCHRRLARRGNGAPRLFPRNVQDAWRIRMPRGNCSSRTDTGLQSATSMLREDPAAAKFGAALLNFLGVRQNTSPHSTDAEKLFDAALSGRSSLPSATRPKNATSLRKMVGIEKKYAMVGFRQNAIYGD
jgi:hypothetical protein